MMEIFLDSISPGPITKEQLGTVKIVRVTSVGGDINYIVKSFVITLVPVKGGQPVIIQGIGNRFNANLADRYGNAKPGDLIIIGNLVIQGLDPDKYKLLKAASWTFAK